jgi:hypothetical protein
MGIALEDLSSSCSNPFGAGKQSLSLLESLANHRCIYFTRKWLYIKHACINIDMYINMHGWLFVCLFACLFVCLFTCGITSMPEPTCMYKT